jgi:hypothetical protein
MYKEQMEESCPTNLNLPILDVAKLIQQENYDDPNFHKESRINERDDSKVSNNEIKSDRSLFFKEQNLRDGIGLKIFSEPYLQQIDGNAKKK